MVAITQDELDQLAQLDKQRTQGKWELCCDDCQSFYDNTDRKLVVFTLQWEDGEGAANARYLEKLLDLAPRLQQELEQVRQERDNLKQHLEMVYQAVNSQLGYVVWTMDTDEHGKTTAIKLAKQIKDETEKRNEIDTNDEVSR